MFWTDSDNNTKISMNPIDRIRSLCLHNMWFTDVNVFADVSSFVQNKVWYNNFHIVLNYSTMGDWIDNIRDRFSYDLN